MYGAFDPLNAIADICQRHTLWMHVDVRSPPSPHHTHTPHTQNVYDVIYVIFVSVGSVGWRPADVRQT